MGHLKNFRPEKKKQSQIILECKMEPKLFLMHKHTVCTVIIYIKIKSKGNIAECAVMCVQSPK